MVMVDITVDEVRSDAPYWNIDSSYRHIDASFPRFDGSYPGNRLYRDLCNWRARHPEKVTSCI